MFSNQHYAMGGAIVASAIIAGIWTFGSAVDLSPVGAAIAQSPLAETRTPCAGQTWPNFDAACLAELAEDGRVPARIIVAH